MEKELFNMMKSIQEVESSYVDKKSKEFDLIIKGQDFIKPALKAIPKTQVVAIEDKSQLDEVLRSLSFSLTKEQVDIALNTTEVLALVASVAFMKNLSKDVITNISDKESLILAIIFYIIYAILLHISKERIKVLLSKIKFDKHIAISSFVIEKLIEGTYNYVSKI